MAEFIDPAIVPKVTLSSGEEVPCMDLPAASEGLFS